MGTLRIEYDPSPRFVIRHHGARGIASVVTSLGYGFNDADRAAGECNALATLGGVYGVWDRVRFREVYRSDMGRL